VASGATLANGAEAETAPLEQIDGAEYIHRYDTQRARNYDNMRAHHDFNFAAPATVKELLLTVTGLNEKADLEPRHFERDPDNDNKRAPSNCTVQEWETYGWFGATPPPAVSGELQITLRNLITGEVQPFENIAIDLPAFGEVEHVVEGPSTDDFAYWNVEAIFTPANNSAEEKLTASINTVFVPANSPHLETKLPADSMERGLHCSSGWFQTNGFGRGMRSRLLSRGWGGEDGEIWCWENNTMEWGINENAGPGAMFINRGRPCHYINPWKFLQNGEYAWDEVADGMLAKFVTGEFRDRGIKNFHVVGSDRWNGVPIGATWGWAEMCNFDLYLRDELKLPGLTGRSWKQLAAEISDQYGDVWQRWHLDRYANKLIATKEKFAEHGINFVFETHGSFPFAGGEFGAKLAQTHAAVGTDLFWELRKQDLLWSLGTRYAIIAVNPDLKSGAYNQWGWVNSEANKWWYANNSAVEPAKRQWYATYFIGRLTQDSQFAPYHHYGFGLQGGVSTIMTPTDEAHFSRAGATMVNLRPAAATGIGLIVSWNRYEKSIGNKLTRSGFGLYGVPPEEDIEAMFADTYHKLAKSGAPLAFVGNTDSLREWSGKQPLVLIDGVNYSPEEFVAARRLNAEGTTIIAIGAPKGDADAEVKAFFGADKISANGAGESAIAHQKFTDGRGDIIYVPVIPHDLTFALARQINELTGLKLELPTGVSVQPFIAQERLFLPFADHSDSPREIEVIVRPTDFLPEGTDTASWQIIDWDEGTVLETLIDAQDASIIGFKFAMPASGGRMFVLTPTP
jgi:hypothetical protein